MLLGTGNVMTLGQVLDDLFSRPTSREQFGLRLGKAPFDIGNESIIGTGGTELVRVLEVKYFVGATYRAILLARMYTRVRRWMLGVA
jgi:hypothetical protein